MILVADFISYKVNMGKNINNGLHNPTVRVLRIFENLNQYPSGLTLSEISKKTTFPKSTISPIINALWLEGYINKNKGTSKYSIGMKTFLIGSTYSLNCNSIEIIKDEMETIVSICNEVCQLGVFIEDSVFYLIKVDSNLPIKLLSSVGTKIPAYATALGKALLSGYRDEDIRIIYKDGLKPFTNNTITDLDVLLEQLEGIRIGGLAYEFEEINKDTGCYAIPLKKHGEVIAAISISFPLFRISEKKIDVIKETLYEKGAFIEQLINDLDLTF